MIILYLHCREFTIHLYFTIIVCIACNSFITPMCSRLPVDYYGGQWHTENGYTKRYKW